MSNGSPQPMTTTWEILTPASLDAAYTCWTISPAERFRTRPPRVEAQKRHPILQPTCDEMQREYPYS